MRAYVLAAAAVLGGCAHPWNTMNIPPGTPHDEVIARAGPPIRELPLPGGGQRMQYTLQPLGRYAFMVDLDPSGRVVQTRQVLTPSEFNRIQPGWTRDDVLREFGPPAELTRVTSFYGDVMTYRWAEGNNPMFYFVYVDPNGIVQRSHQGMEFINSPADRK
ncbi:lipoprotein [Ramlibacter monticola]|uniref:Outer membrane protein assembly factor BamE n=1 Tax=Ramlibacter monticola TaxID=1926872 RepID=A0A936Z4H2_9BURK|nr:hypothetical protein [Ramlibacter monticola]MBL0394753.1 hypothetical protein [Ramlibacter monticola]